MDTVSVIMPCFNDGLYLREAIESLKAQTYKDIELILIDDGSTDSDTLQALELAKMIDRNQILHTERLGPSQARNVGIEHATGKYILPLDSDDRIDPTYIEKALNILKSDAQIGAVYCYAEMFGERSGRWELPDYSIEKMLLDNIVFVSAVYYKSDWEKIGGYKAIYNHGMEDYDFWLSLLELGRTIHQIPEVLFYYRIKSVSRTTRFMESMGNVQETYRMLYTSHPALYEKYRDQYAIILRQTLVEQIFDCRYMSIELDRLRQQSARHTFIDQALEKIPSPIRKISKKLMKLVLKKNIEMQGG